MYTALPPTNFMTKFTAPSSDWTGNVDQFSRHKQASRHKLASRHKMDYDFIGHFKHKLVTSKNVIIWRRESGGFHNISVRTSHNIEGADLQERGHTPPL